MQIFFYFNKSFVILLRKIKKSVKEKCLHLISKCHRKELKTNNSAFLNLWLDAKSRIYKNGKMFIIREKLLEMT